MSADFLYTMYIHTHTWIRINHMYKKETKKEKKIHRFSRSYYLIIVKSQDALIVRSIVAVRYCYRNHDRSPMETVKGLIIIIAVAILFSPYRLSRL